MIRIIGSRVWCIAFILLSIGIVLSASQRYNYYNYQQQRINAQRAQSYRQQVQRVQAQNRRPQNNRRGYPGAANNNRNRIDRSDLQNAKFLGAKNQEVVDTERTFGNIRRIRQSYLGNPCYLRNAGKGNQAEGRFLWDVNVYNIYQNPPVYPAVGCSGFNGYGPYNQGFFHRFINLFLPGGALAPGPVRPLLSPVQTDSVGGGGGGSDDVQSDPEIDPNLGGTGSGSTTGSGSSGGSSGSSGGNSGGGTGSAVTNGNNPPLGQLVGGLAGTVNSFIQQLSGNAPIPNYG